MMLVSGRRIDDDRQQGSDGRGGEEAWAGQLSLFMSKHGLCDAADRLQITKFPNGQSNPTYKIKTLPRGVRTAKFYVLRRKPFGALLPKAHQINREYMLLQRLYNACFPVPKVLVYCEDEAVIGAQFYIMEFVDGVVFRDPLLPSLTHSQRRKVYFELAKVLRQLHTIPLEDLDLPKDFVKHSFFSRQLHVWTKQYKLATTLAPPITEFEELAKKLSSRKHAVVEDLVLNHGDFRLDNVIFNPKTLNVVAVLDWELASTGPSLGDLSYCALAYHMTPEVITGVDIPGLKGQDLARLSIPSESNFLQLYGLARRPPHWESFLGLSALRLASIAQGVYARSIQGNASAENAGELGAVAVTLSQTGLKCLEAADVSSNADRGSSSSEETAVVAPVTSVVSTLSERAQALYASLDAFIRDFVIPREPEWADLMQSASDRWHVDDTILEDLKGAARERGLWNLFLPAVSGLTQFEYAPLAELMGTSLLAAEACNCSAPDSGNMEVLHMFGSAEQKKAWLEPLLDGSIRSCFCMTEPDVASSDATNMQCTIELDATGNEYVVNGKKWWSTGAGSPHCKIALVMGRTSNAKKSRHEQHSIILVPMDAKGVVRVRPLRTFGYDDAPHGHFEVHFNNVRVPKENLILGEGKGFFISQARLGPGRLHHCMRAIGTCERALSLMCDRALKRKTFGKRLAQHGMVQEMIAQSRIEIDQGRLLVLEAARVLDGSNSKIARKHLSMAKVAVARMGQRVLDRAIQVFGGAGVSDDYPLALMFAGLRTLRIADGPDEVHLLTVAKEELKPKVARLMAKL